MSHELRTPLNHIMGFTELVVTKSFGELNELQEEYLGDVLLSSRHLLSLIDDILDISKIEEGRMEITRSAVDVRSLVEKSLLMIKEKALKHAIRLSVDTDTALPVIQADERKLKQVIYNLLANAVKFTPDGGVLTLEAREVDPLTLPQQAAIDGLAGGNGHRYVEFIVSDTGIGIKSEDRERIFNRFEQVDRSSHRRYQGCGLGLALCKNFVELHGGTIWVESAGQGKGSAFHFVVPA
jgi:signal transduction histidine kinase